MSGLSDNRGLSMKSKYSVEEKSKIILKSFSDNITQAEIYLATEQVERTINAGREASAGTEKEF